MERLPPTARLVGIGSYVAACIVIFSLGGRELDKLMDSEPVLTLAGLLLGVFLALWGAIHQLLEVMSEISQRQAEEKKE